MKRTVALIGTSHTYQRPGSLAADEFRRFVELVSIMVNAKAIAEEASTEALSQHHAAQSVCKIIADGLAIAHRYCDPSNEERRLLGIRGMQEIQLEGFYKNSNPEEIAERISVSHRKRECYWLQQLMHLDTWPAVFICGACHVESFCAALRMHGLHVDVVVFDWQPINIASC